MSQKKVKKSTLSADEKIVALAKERFAACVKREEKMRLKALDDLNFRAGDQWPADVLAQRKALKRPVITVNKIPQFCRNVANEMKQNKSAVKVYAADSQAKKETAEVFQGMFRNIEYNSNAGDAYASAGEGAVEKSFGFFRVIREYINSESFQQHILIKGIANHFSCYLGPHNEADGSDSNHGFVFDDMDKDEFEEKWPETAESIDDSFWKSTGSDGWFTEKTIRVCEYYTKTMKTKVLCQMADGSAILEEKLTDEDKPFVIKKRNTMKPEIKWYKIAGNKIVERTDVPGSYIPLIPVYGARLNINGEWTVESVHRHSQDSQRTYNYYKSTEVENIAMTPKAPYVAAIGQITPEVRPAWENSNIETQAVLEYNPVEVNGSLAPAPQRNSYEPAIMAVTNATQLASEDIKATTGIYDDSLGKRSNADSGKAIERRTAQSQISNYHFLDNQAKSIRHCGRICVEWIPVVYDTEQMTRIIGEDGTQEMVKINGEFEKAGQNMKHMLDEGVYDTIISVGPSYESRRQEAAAMLMDFAKAMPMHAGNIADLIAKNSDWPGAQEMAERFRKLLPPGLIDDKDKPPIPPEIQAKMAEMEQMCQALSGQLIQAKQDAAIEKAKLESKERIEFAKLENDMQIEVMKVNHVEALTAMTESLKMVQNRLGILDINKEISFDEPVENNLDVDQQNMMPSGGPAPEDSEQ